MTGPPGSATGGCQLTVIACSVNVARTSVTAGGGGTIGTSIRVGCPGRPPCEMPRIAYTRLRLEGGGGVGGGATGCATGADAAAPAGGAALAAAAVGVSGC